MTRPNDDRSKLERFQDELEALDLGKRFSEGFKEPFDAIYGYTILHEDAPKEEHYEEWEEYALVAHEWAIEELQDRHQAAIDALEAIPVDEHPRLGHDHPDDRELRDDIDDAIFEAHKRLAEVVEAREWLGSLEESYRDN